MYYLRNPAIPFLFAILLLLPLYGQKFLIDDPIRRDKDSLPFPEPLFVELSPSFDLAENTFGKEGKGPPVRAQNVNTLGEVPDSSWFTNRIGIREISIEDLVQGGSEEPLDATQSITVVGAALIAVTAGLVVRDRRNNLYYVKFDPADIPNMATAADNITSKLMYAVGYNVLPTSIAYLDPSRLVIAPSAVVRLLGGKEKPLDQEFIDLALKQTHREDSGLYRVVAHPLPPGNLLGGFKFFGTRGDDANDIFLHENRRELRGLRVFSAWLNHVYCRSLNTMDVFIPVETDGKTKGAVKHYLVDFSTSLGSGYDLNERIVPKEPEHGYEYTFWGDHNANIRTGLTLGIWERPWMRIKYPYPEYAEIGRIESMHFDPNKWKPNYPNAAFDRMQPDDDFWAAKIVARFSEEAIRAIVHEGEFSNPEAEAYLADVLVARQHKILDYYFRKINPLDNFEIAVNKLVFENLGQKCGLPFDSSYQYLWHAFDNQQGKLTPLESWRYTGLPTLPIPHSSAEYLMVRIKTRADEAPGWLKSVDVYLRNTEQTSIVGIERDIGFPDLEPPAKTDRAIEESESSHR